MMRENCSKDFAAPCIESAKELATGYPKLALIGSRAATGLLLAREAAFELTIESIGPCVRDLCRRLMLLSAVAFSVEALCVEEAANLEVAVLSKTCLQPLIPFLR